jgi:hypothetical protein
MRLAWKVLTMVFMLYRNIEEAANVAFTQKDEAALNSLLGRCGTNRTLTSKIESLKAQLSQRK